jgi:hypothetical protein
MAILAEVGDKVPSVAATITLSIALSAFLLGLGQLRWWLGVVAGAPLLAFWNLSIYWDATETTVAPLLAAELGEHYVLGQLVAANVPVILAITVAAVYQRRRQLAKTRALLGRCTRCGYAAPPNPRPCPECGLERSPIPISPK